MSVLLATAILLIGAGGYVSCSLREEKELQKRSQRQSHFRDNSITDGPGLLGTSETFTTKKPDHQGCDQEPSLLGQRTAYSYASNQYNRSQPELLGKQPELLGREAFEAKRKTA